MTDQQNRIKETLFSLIETAGSLLTVQILGKEERNAYTVKETSAFMDRNKVILFLFEPENIYSGYDKWAEAIIQAEQMCGELEKERFHNEAHPNFFKAIQAKFNNRK